MKKTLHLIIILFFLGVSLNPCIAQSKKDLLLEGDFMYETENYSDAEANYQKATDKDPDFQTHFNLGVSQEKQVSQGNNQTAQQAMQAPQEDPNIQNALSNYQSALSFAKDDTERSMALYNMGNTMIADKANVSIEKLEEAIENYKAAIRYDKNNDPARHNLALTQIMLDRARQQEQQQQQQQENQDSESEENQEQEEQEQQDQQEQEQEDQQQQEQQEQKSEEQKEQEMEAQKQKVDEKEIENILKMVEQEDKEVQQKMRKQTKSSDTNKKKKW